MVNIIDNTAEAFDGFGWNHGGDVITVTKEQIEALLSGKAWAIDINGGEYSLFINKD